MKPARLHSCNVLRVSADSRQIWRFGFDNEKAVLEGEITARNSEPLPAKWAVKDWRCLWQRKVNLVWLPPDQVFLRAIQLPVTEASELQAMVELQLEKLSPLPVAQIVWSYEVLSGQVENQQTVIVIMVARNLVEEFLGSLEGQGYLADRLEVPLLHQLLTVPVENDGVWIYPSEYNGKKLCLAAWWSRGTLQNLNLLHLSDTDNWGDILSEQLTQIGWAGEMEGWLATTPRCTLVADSAATEVWKPVLMRWARDEVQIVSALSPGELAALNAQRLAHAESKANLLPGEFAIRYRQQFVDRLWMGGLGAVIGLYVAGVLVFFAWLQVINFQHHRVLTQIEKFSKDYNAAMQLKARVRVLQEQVSLRFAALECWKAACALLPTGLTLTDLQLQQGKTLMIAGIGPADEQNKILSYNKSLSDYRVNGPGGTRLFSRVLPYNTHANPGNNVAWNFTCELSRPEVE